MRHIILKENHAKVVHFLISCIAYMVIKSCSDVIQVAQQSEQTFLLFVVPHLIQETQWLLSVFCVEENAHSHLWENKLWYWPCLTNLNIDTLYPVYEFSYQYKNPRSNLLSNAIPLWLTSVPGVFTYFWYL